MSFVVNGIRRHVSESLCVCPQKALIYHHMLYRRKARHFVSRNQTKSYDYKTMFAQFGLDNPLIPEVTGMSTGGWGERGAEVGVSLNSLLHGPTCARKASLQSE